MKALDLHGRVNDDITALTWESIVSSLQAKYRSLKGQHICTPQVTGKIKQDKELSSLHVAVNKITARIGSNGDGVNGGGRPQNNLGAESRKCYNCGKSGHLARDCQENKEEDGAVNCLKIPPKAETGECVTMDSVVYMWCQTCR